MERPRGLEPPPTAWQAVVLPLYYGRSEQPIYSMGVERGQDRWTRAVQALGESAVSDPCNCEKLFVREARGR